jgi:hypothetical protein
MDNYTHNKLCIVHKLYSILFIVILRLFLYHHAVTVETLEALFSILYYNLSHDLGKAIKVMLCNNCIAAQGAGTHELSYC